ncbi:Hydrophobe/amphiphile Efflux-1 (HAE1) Family protein [Hyella patelloides LEGE 07179]|uniref:Hydrophobe/amphiphile Efflux-1 (HAE1) Family protein n=1 Tax=Hyella patelloides LEGE 07179 TaxID=945734 RepID=A0A563VNJ1_9CYAN|nr:efflux RND transporter permease subunit [Hyella patelloides]VEP13030.1 Hydrophobe/amphiphile Efflux-1 (HAE1) Family protein [Hyella patelloides LEGE 07179]
MSISTPFIKRPVLTTVCTIVIVLLGVICIALLPLDKLPQIAPKQITVSANYVGADARTTVDNVTTVLEREINGTEDVRWINSNTDNNGNATINVSFPVEKDTNIAQVLVQNRVAQAQSNLPQSVLATGVTTEKQSPSITLAYAFSSEKDENGEYYYDPVFIYNYVNRYLWNELRKIEGVGSLSAFGSASYSMRIWLDPNKLAARGLTASDVVGAIQNQNFEVGAGGVGRQPVPIAQQYELPLRVNGRFTTVEEAESLVVQAQSDGTLIKIKDVGRAELGVEDYFTKSIFDGEAPAVGLLIYQLPGTNALNTAELVKAKMAELEADFPRGLKAEIAHDNTLFINSSLQDLVVTLVQAIGLVVLIIFIFLQDWRTTLIPAIAIPVALIGAMIALQALGFTLNQLTLFACVLATGLVVDDGIVIVEAVSAKLSQGMRPVQAALDAMEELVGAVISTSVVLMAVFIPVTFFPGTTGIVYKQFALTIAFAVVFSTFNALTFSPSMSGVFLRRTQPVKGPLGWLFPRFNRSFDWLKERYRSLIEFLTNIKLFVIAIFIGGLVLTGWTYTSLPQGFVPEEDQGYFFVLVEAPPGVSLNYTHNITQQAAEMIMEYEEVEHSLAFSGFSFDGQNSNKGVMFVKLHPWNQRLGDSSSVFGLLQRINQQFQQHIDGASVIAVNAPPVDGLSNFGGSEIYIQDRQGRGMETLMSNTQQVIAAANERPEIAFAFTTFTFDSPMLEADINRNQANAQNVDISEILNTLQTYLGSNFVNQFVLDGRLYRVYAQAEAERRSNPDDINRLSVRSRDGELIRLSSLINVQQISYPPIVSNYNVYPAIRVIVAPTPGYSSGQVITAMEEVAEATLQPGFGYEWTNTAAEEKTAGGAAPLVFGLAFVMVFLVLAAQYESYIDPLIIMLTVPLAILGALGGIWLRATFLQAGGVWPVLNNNIYAQVGLVMLIGMASKNAILIVEFANQNRDLGMSIEKASIFASEQRFRAILMTAISTLVGFMPLLIASGAGAVSRWSLGTAVFGGMLVATALSLIFVPILYIVIKNFEQSFLKRDRKKDGGTQGRENANHHNNGTLTKVPSETEKKQSTIKN